MTANSEKDLVMLGSKTSVQLYEQLAKLRLSRSFGLELANAESRASQGLTDLGFSSRLRVSAPVEC